MSIPTYFIALSSVGDVREHLPVQGGLPGFCWAENPASIQSREEMKKWQFLQLI